MGRNSLRNILNDFKNTCPENNYMFIDIPEDMPKRNLYREYEEIYLHNRSLIERSLEALTIQRRNETIKKALEKLYEECLYPENTKIEKLEKAIKPVPSVPSHLIKDMREPGDMTNAELHEYFGVEEFNDCIMFNCSPNWKGDCCNYEHCCRIEFLQLVLQKFYEDCNRFTRYKYVIECGKEGNHTHAHCILEFNPKMKKSNATWLKSNINRTFKDIWKKVNEGIEGDYEGMVDNPHSLQRIILRTKILRDDKLDYLIEEKKPFSHQNANHQLYPRLGGNWD